MSDALLYSFYLLFCASPDSTILFPSHLMSCFFTSSVSYFCFYTCKSYSFLSSPILFHSFILNFSCFSTTHHFLHRSRTLPDELKLNVQCSGTGEIGCSSTQGGVVTSGGGFSNSNDRNRDVSILCCSVLYHFFFLLYPFVCSFVCSFVCF